MAAKKKTAKKKRIRAPLAKRHGPNVLPEGENPTHDERGKFLPNNGLGGNPTAGAQMRFRAQLQEIAEEIERGEQASRFRRLAKAVFRKALAGEEWAAKELLARLCGKHPNYDDEPPLPSPPPIEPSGPVTINTQFNLQGMSPKQAAMTEYLISVAEKFLPADRPEAQE